MQKRVILSLLAVLVAIASFSFRPSSGGNAYLSLYDARLKQFQQRQQDLLSLIQKSDLKTEKDVENIRAAIRTSRNDMKGMDFWMRYLEPIAYKRINGPLPVEWETEVFEKFEKPYKRDGAGLTLAALYLDEEEPLLDTLASLVSASIEGTLPYAADSITSELTTHHHFYFCNRLFLLNLAAIYTTGFECPETEQIVPELRSMLDATGFVYKAFNDSYTATSLTQDYLALYEKMKAFVLTQPADYTEFDHFTFLRDYVNPLYGMNQKMMLEYKVVTRSMVDYSLNKQANSIFSKDLYRGQNTKGLFHRVTDSATLAEIDHLGKLLFYDPILSGNNERSCASCHKPTQFFTDTTVSTAFQFNHTDALPRNAPSLVNAGYNHLIMVDGKHFSLQNQTHDVMTNPLEMMGGGQEEQILEKVLSCGEYRKAFEALLKYTPTESEVTLEHLSSAITYYYSKFSQYYSPFDRAMNNQGSLTATEKHGFNLFMSKAQCATCHFVPQFNGVKPPYVGSEFEVLGVPKDKKYQSLDTDSGRYGINPAKETLNAFRTGTVRNAAQTMPYMHNGVFTTLQEVVDFYNTGGGAGHGLAVANQTLSSDSLQLTALEQEHLIHFINGLTEEVQFEAPPSRLPTSKKKALNTRKVGGVY